MVAANERFIRFPPPFPPIPEKRRLQARNRILKALLHGATESAAAAYGRVDPSTLRRWKAADEVFRLDVQAAKASARLRPLEKILRHNDWRAQAWLLERWQPKLFGSARSPAAPAREGRHEADEGDRWIKQQVMELLSKYEGDDEEGPLEGSPSDKGDAARGGS